MALAMSTSTNLCSFSPFPNTRSTTCYLSHYSVSCPKSPISNISSLGLRPLSLWNGLRHLGVSISHKSIRKIERKGRCKGKLVYASLFGVGAPEALVIGVVALLVFGPKGLAEVARNLGQTLRTFQPTIRELQDVSREFKSTLEREIGLDDISMSSQNRYNSNTTKTSSTPSSSSTTEDIVSPPSSSSATVEDISSTTSPSAIAEDYGPPMDLNDDPSPNRAYTSEEYLKITEEQLKASASQQQEETPSTPVTEIQPQPQGTAEEAPVVKPSLQKSES